MKKISAKMLSPKNEIVLMNGKGAMTVEGMERIFKALAGRGFTPSERETAQKKLDDHDASQKTMTKNQLFETVWGSAVADAIGNRLEFMTKVTDQDFADHVMHR